jgi:hypothetical protein
MPGSTTEQVGPPLVALPRVVPRQAAATATPPEERPRVVLPRVVLHQAVPQRVVVMALEA